MNTNRPALFLRFFTAGLLLAASGPRTVCAADAPPEPAAATAPATNETTSLETLRSYLQLQEQLHATQLAIEQTRQEAKEVAAQSAAALNVRLDAIEGALASQRARELEAMQSSNRVMLFMAGTFAAIGFIAMLLMAYFQWRTVHGLAEISAAMPAPRALGPARAVAALGAGDHQPATAAVEQSNAELLGALEQLEKRIGELERAGRLALEAGGSGRVSTPGPAALRSGNGEPEDGSSGTVPAEPKTVKAEPLRELLAEGQRLLDRDESDGALATFAQALAIDPRNPEALVKKGTALERLRKLDQAMECYDQAIAADGSLTVAYLHKAGLYNRMEKFSEALEWYEKALSTQEKRET